MILEAKQEMKDIIKDSKTGDDIVLIKLNYSNGNVDDKEFEFLDENEFLYQGQMFDISSSEVRGNYIYFYCVNDTSEEAITQQLATHVQDNLTDIPTVPKKSNILEKIFLNEYIPQKNLTLEVPPLSETKLFFPQEKVLTLKLDIETPPPKFFLVIV